MRSVTHLFLKARALCNECVPISLPPFFNSAVHMSDFPGLRDLVSSLTEGHCSYIDILNIYTKRQRKKTCKLKKLPASSCGGIKLKDCVVLSM